MEKLIELLNEYEKKELKSEFYEWEKGVGGDTNLFRRDTRDEEGSHIYSDTADTYVISKKFGFIKWLVENDKININEEWNDYEKTNLYCNSDFFQLQKHYSYYESLLMLLSISDTPIEDLISYLK